MEVPNGRRDDFVDPYFKGAGADAVVVILKAREPARIMTAVGDSKTNRWHLQIANRWVVQYNFYINDRQWGRMFVRICPYLPFSARVCLNQHHWLANRMREEGIDFKQCANAFMKCAAPERLQQLAESLSPRDLLTCGQKWLGRLTPFFTAKEREQAGCQHRLFFSQVEFCDNLIFHRRAALDKLGERLLDANRTIGQPNKISVIFGRRISKHYRGKLQTEIEDMDLPNPVIRSHYGNVLRSAATPGCASVSAAITTLASNVFFIGVSNTQEASRKIERIDHGSFFYFANLATCVGIRHGEAARCSLHRSVTWKSACEAAR
jgi:hypothetical protein